MIDWTGVFSRGFGGVGRVRGVHGTITESDGRARYFVGATGLGCMFLLCAIVAMKVNVWLGLGCMIVAARRLPELRRAPESPRTTPKPTATRGATATRKPTVKRPTALQTYSETLVILSKDALGAEIQGTFDVMREHGKSAEVAAEIALRHHEDELRDAGLNLPCFNA